MLIMLCASSPELAFRASYLELFLGCFSVWLIDMHQLLKQIQFKINILYSIMFAYVLLRKSKLLVITYFNFSDLPLFGKKCSFECTVFVSGFVKKTATNCYKLVISKGFLTWSNIIMRETFISLRGVVGKRELKHVLHKLHQITFSAVGKIFIKGDLEL